MNWDPESEVAGYLASHLNLKDYAATRGIKYTTLYRWLRVRGLTALPRGSADRVPRPDGANLRAEYSAGASVKYLAQQHGVARDTMNRWLDDLAVDRRGRSEAMEVRWERATSQEREAMLAAAHAAARREHAPDERRAMSSARERNVSWVAIGERETHSALEARGLTLQPQVAEGPWNIDLSRWPMALEVHRRTSHPMRTRHLSERADGLTAAGWVILYLWCARGAQTPGAFCLTEGAADAIAAFAEAMPTSGVHVLRCDGTETQQVR